MFLTIILFAFLILWGLADFIYWKTGKETMSQYVITQIEKHPWLRWVVLVLLFGAAGVLTWHWELL